jgi:hypothetical protein
MTAPIDWRRVAEPQPDGYDSEVALGLAVATGYRPREIAGCATFLGGAVAVREDPVLLDYDDCRYADIDHPNIATAESLLELWPEAHAQCRTLLESVCFYDCPRLGPDMVIGSICGAGSSGFGSVIVTVNHHMGLAEGIVHEMAHHKLRALGIEMESSTRLILNPPDQRYPSPIRYDCLRPMTAVLHAQYSYTYIAQFDLKVLEQDDDNIRSRAIRERSLSVIIPKLEYGLRTISEQAITDDAGEQFCRGFRDWCDRIISAGYRDLEANGITPKSFLHPIAGT